MEIAALAGGVGASKLLLGLSKIMAPEDLTIIVNTGDDVELHGLSISPDLDIVTYTLAGIVNPQTGWGIRGDTFAALKALGRLGGETWFNLGDRDLATHIQRTALLRSGATLSQAADCIRKALGLKSKIIPMSDQPVRTMIETAQGTLNFQEYLVKHKAGPKVKGIVFSGVGRAKPAPGVLEALARAEVIVICPSNPLISIGPILAVPGILDALRARRKDVLAVSPIVGGRSLKGPSDKMLLELGLEPSAQGVARLYREFAGCFVIDSQDVSLQPAIESLGMRVVGTATVMQSDADKQRLARFVLLLAAERSLLARV